MKKDVIGYSCLYFILGIGYLFAISSICLKKVGLTSLVKQRKAPRKNNIKQKLKKKSALQVKL